MATIQTVLFLTLLLSSPFRPTIAAGDIHDLLVQYGLPKGLLPNNVKSYEFNAEDGSFTVELRSKCYVTLTDLVHYGKEIKGMLSYGELSNLSGISVKKLFAWIPITGMVARQKDQTIEIQVGFLSETLPVSLFKDITECRSRPAQSI